ncbi:MULTISPECIES: M1 family metallopeptidase [unclassified Streptomyces]|uniref:M1 family metallopeptidase n=1 Tax=unclassified Streptomyces TaxID=2593676 RepID=UPI000DD5F46E|nr:MULTISPECIES: M1 family metallopeptidase [unclassified Streptomyces]QZZ25728.1 M1 family metallopeptidase [Streptomyces sp. ST1015]
MSRHPSTPTIAVALAATLLGLTACTTAEATPALRATGTPRPGAAGLGDPLHPGLGNGGYDVRHYGLDLRFTKDLKQYTATSTVQARASQALSRFNLDLSGTTVREVTVDGRTARWSRSGEELRVTPAAPLRRGERFTVRVRVQAPVLDPRQAAQLGTGPVVGMFRDGSWVQTINQPSGAHRIAALADHPAQKAPATITITAPSRLNSIANGDLTATRRDGAYSTRRFESRQKLATELLQIGVGPFTVVHKKGPHGIELRYALPTEQARAIEPQLDKTVPEAIRFLEHRLGRGSFPLRTYGVYATPIGGELETQSLTLLNAGTLTPEGFADNGTDGVVEHEISHEYFGNSVSPRRWSDLWLNEGHAVYYETLWMAEHHGVDLEQSMREMYREANAGLRREGPIAAPRRSAFKPRAMAPYGWNAYQGGALTLYALRQKVGEADFQRIERAWVREHRDGVADTAGFIRLAGRVTGRDLGPFLRSWLYAEKVPPMPGHPDWRS